MGSQRMMHPGVSVMTAGRHVAPATCCGDLRMLDIAAHANFDFLLVADILRARVGNRETAEHEACIRSPTMFEPLVLISALAARAGFS